MSRTPMRGLVLAIGVAGLAVPALAQFGPTPVYLEPAVTKTIRRSVELVGVVDPRRTSTLGAEVPGRVETLHVDEGDYVATGAPVVDLKRDSVRIQRRRAEAQLASAKAELEKLTEGYRPEEIAQAEARVAGAEASLAKWDLEFKRTQKLLAEGAGTEAEMESVQASFRQAEESLAEARANLRLLRSGFRIEEVRAAQARVQAHEAAVDELQDMLEKMTIAMPFAGFVVEKHAEVGEWLTPGSPVVRVVDLDVVRIEVTVPERYLEGVRRGFEAPVVLESFPDRELTGTVRQIIPASAALTHTVTVRLDVKNTIEDGRPSIAAGLAARVWLPVGEPRQALLVPKDAVIRQQGEDRVYTIADEPPPREGPEPPKRPPTENEKAMAEAMAENAPYMAEQLDAAGVPSPSVRYAVPIPVRLVGGYGTLMEVESPTLEPGMKLVTRGTYLMRAGAEVQVRPKESPPPEKKAAAMRVGRSENEAPRDPTIPERPAP